MAFILPGASIMASTSPSTSIGEASEITAPDMVRMNSNGPTPQKYLGKCEILPLGIFDPDFGAIPDKNGWLPTGTYDLWAELYVEPGCQGPAEVKVFLEIYQELCDNEKVLEFDDFEDNWDIYNNWIQIDGDCGIAQDGSVGFYDTWTWSDARANCGTHSMKSTMYDVYKGNQDDYLEKSVGFDICDQYAVNVSFDIWVAGDGQLHPDLEQAADGTRSQRYILFDYLEFVLLHRFRLY
jgi:hypothetical protein